MPTAMHAFEAELKALPRCKTPLCCVQTVSPAAQVWRTLVLLHAAVQTLVVSTLVLCKHHLEQAQRCVQQAHRSRILVATS